MAIMTYKEVAFWIKKNIPHLDKIMVYTEECDPPYTDGWLIDTAGNAYHHLLDPENGFDLEAKHNVRIGKILL